MKSTVLFVMLLCAAFLVACNGTTNVDAQADASADAGAQEDSTDTDAAVDAAVDVDVDVDLGETIDDAVDDVRSEFANAMGTAQYKVTYNVASSQGGAAGDLVMTQYVRAKSGDDYNFRTDVTVQGIETRSYITGGVVTSCTKFGGNWNCNEVDTNSMETSNPSADAQAAAESDAQITRDGTKVVAGVNADCYKVVNDDGTVRYCIGDGVPLFVETITSQGTNTVEATSYSKTVVDSDFTPPASASAAGSGAGGFTLPEGYQMPGQ
jgi:hypothetical protein